MKRFFYIILISVAFSTFISCGAQQDFPIHKYYAYDKELPLNDSVTLVSDSPNLSISAVSFTSVHNKNVTGLLSIPKNTPSPMPVVILMHGKGDRVTVDYIEAGHQHFVENGYAVLRINIANHGDREENNYDFSLTDGFRYWTRDILSQTVFDLRRSIDFLNTRKEIDSERIGYYGISLGGIIGTVFCGVDERVKVPVIALAGGNLNLMFGMDALSEETLDFMSFIDPINFVELIHPRPILMINSENDEVVSPITSKLLYQKAKQPKNIIWYPSKHRDLPIGKAYQDGVDWFQKHL